MTENAGFVGWMHFGIQVALPPGTDTDLFGEELAEHIQFNLAAGLGDGRESLTGAVHFVDQVPNPWHPSIGPFLSLVDAPES